MTSDAVTQPREFTRESVGFVVARVCQGVLAILAGLLIFKLAIDQSPFDVGVDYRQYREAAERWLAGGPFYHPWQLAGPYAIGGASPSPVLYPPIALILFVPFVYLPAFLWWAIPMAATAIGVWRLKPAWWAWPLILMLALVPSTPGLWLWGNPGMWMLAGETLGFMFGWPALIVLFKPSLAPFVLTGAGKRSWWLGLAVLGLICLPFGRMWLDWWQAAIVGPTDVGVDYSRGYLAVSFIPVVAWASSHLPGKVAHTRMRLERLKPGHGRPLGVPQATDLNVSGAELRVSSTRFDIALGRLSRRFQGGDDNGFAIRIPQRSG